MRPSSEERSWLTTAVACASQITTVAGQMVLPALLGLWLDQRMGTVGVFLVLGTILGFASGLYQLVLWVQGTSRKGKSGPLPVEPEGGGPLIPSGAKPRLPLSREGCFETLQQNNCPLEDTQAHCKEADRQ